MQIIIDKLLTNYQQWGKGSKHILLLHGWSDSSKTFQQLAKNLEKDYRLTAPDLPGAGGSQTPEADWSVPDYAKFVGRFLDKLDIKPDIIIGHSNGGTIAMYGLANGQLTAKRVVLLASAGVRDRDQARKTVLRLAAKPLKLILAVLPASAQKRIKKRAYGAIGSDLYAAEHLQGTFKNVVGYDIQKEATKVSTPALLIYGDKDESTPPAYGQVLQAKLKQAELMILTDAGHFLHQEEPKEIAEAIRGDSHD